MASKEKKAEHAIDQVKSETLPRGDMRTDLKPQARLSSDSLLGREAQIP